MRVLQNLALNERRRVKRHPETSLDSLLNLAGETPANALEDMLPKQLSKADREILIWRFEQNMDYDEIADRLGISETGCRSRVSRAVKHCRELMEKH